MVRDKSGSNTRLTLVGRFPARVLVVDDEPSIARALEICCKRAGYDTLAATSGEEALRLLGELHVDVLITDLRMPDLRGDVLFHLATAMQPHLRVQTLFVTGDLTPRAKELIAACGAVQMLHKPFELADVVQTVRALLPTAATQTA